MVFAHQVVERDLHVDDARQVLGDHALQMPLDHHPMLVRHIVKQGLPDRRFFLGAAKRGEERLEFARVEQAAFVAAGDAGQQTGVENALGRFPGQRLVRQLHHVGEPEGGIDLGLVRAALGQAGAIVVDAPLIGQGTHAQELLDAVGLRRILDRGIGRQGEQLLEHLRATARVRQESVFLQRARRAHQHALGNVFEIQARQVNHALDRLVQIGAQMGGAEKVGDLHHPLGAVAAHGVKLLRIDDAVGQAVVERAREERTLIVSGQRLRWRGGRPSRCQSADSSTGPLAAPPAPSPPLCSTLSAGSSSTRLRAVRIWNTWKNSSG